MKLKWILRALLISFAMLIVAGIAAGVAAFKWFHWWAPLAQEADNKMIHTVRYIGLGLPDEFYDEIMSMPDGYIQLSELKTKLPKDAAKETWGMIGPVQFRQFPGFLYVKKEGRFLCVAVATFLPERNSLQPEHGWKARRFELIPGEEDPHGLEEEGQDLIKAVVISEDGRIILAKEENWDIDPYELFYHGIQFNRKHRADKRDY